MLFRRDVLDGIARGEVTLAFRRWKRAPPRPGATVTTVVGVVEITEVRPVTLGEISEADARRSGAASRAELMASLHSDGALLRMKVRLVGADPRVGLRARRPSATELDAAVEKLARLDGRAPEPWTRAYLDLVARRPGVVSHELARTVGVETVVFKRRVRSLKALGLTESLEVGYRLSPRGRDVLAAMRTRS
jgi:hypothetical protein